MQEKFGFDHFYSFKAPDGKTRNIDDLEEYLRNQSKKIKVKRKLKKGDVVKLYGRNYYVVVEYIDYEMNGIGKVDYAGRRIDGKEENMLSIFNQSEIEKIIQPVNESMDR